MSLYQRLKLEHPVFSGNKIIIIVIFPAVCRPQCPDVEPIKPQNRSVLPVCSDGQNSPLVFYMLLYFLVVLHFFSSLLTESREKKPSLCEIVKDSEGEQSSSQLLRPSADRFLRLGDDEATIKRLLVLCCRKYWLITVCQCETADGEWSQLSGEPV